MPLQLLFTDDTQADTKMIITVRDNGWSIVAEPRPSYH